MPNGNSDNKQVRIKDIAEKADVSTGTVDRVLHNRGRVSEKVKEKVLRIAKELNYEPNMLARALVSKRNYRLAALIPDPSLDEYWEAPQKGIEKAEKDLHQYGVNITQFIFNQNQVESFKKAAEKLTESEFDGILVAPVFYRESLTYLSRWKRMGIPFNLFNTHIPDYEPLSYIGQDSYQSGVLAAKMLHYGHPEPTTFIVAHIDEDVPNSTHLIKKEQGFKDYFDEQTKGEFQIVTADLKKSTDRDFFSEQLNQLLNSNPQTSGIFVTNSKAFAVAEYLDTKSLQSIRLVGYDLLSKNLKFLEKGTINFLINQNPEGQGYFSVQLLIDHLVFKKEISPIKYLPLDIITRENLQYYLSI
ncbi:MAG TPA: LacI family DNA-binding transcriptional regulator [Sunxiuqinia sp.]|nr:LacI family DNA-binding transcriptional regulator [Sunxiuqinia sp.]